MPAAVRMAPDLVSIAAGGNDILRPGADPDVLAGIFDDAVATAACRPAARSSCSPDSTPSISPCSGCSAARPRPTTCTCGRSRTGGNATWPTCGRCARCAMSGRGAPTGCICPLTATGRVALLVSEVLGVPVSARLARPVAAGGDGRLAHHAAPGRPVGAPLRRTVGQQAPARRVIRRWPAAKAPRPATAPALRTLCSHAIAIRSHRQLADSSAAAGIMFMAGLLSYLSKINHDHECDRQRDDHGPLIRAEWPRSGLHRSDQRGQLTRRACGGRGGMEVPRRRGGRCLGARRAGGTRHPRHASSGRGKGTPAGRHGRRLRATAGRPASDLAPATWAARLDRSDRRAPPRGERARLRSRGASAGLSAVSAASRSASVFP